MISLPNSTTSEVISTPETQTDVVKDPILLDPNNKMTTCTATKVNLFYIDKDGCQKMLESCGECESCGLMFSASYLHFHSDVEPEKWPVIYVGRYCKDCWLKD